MMLLTSESLADGKSIPEQNALGKYDPESHATFAANQNPQLTWSGVPDGTKSVAIIGVDIDAPTKPDDVNKEGRTVPADLPRADFYHWVLVDLPPEDGAIAEGELSSGLTAHGKEEKGPRGRRGKNDYTGWFAGNPDMEGDYFGYDGPFPPWNDSIKHRYRFTVYALDVDVCAVEPGFGGGDVAKAIDGHVLDQASINGTYKINPDAK